MLLRLNTLLCNKVWFGFIIKFANNDYFVYFYFPPYSRVAPFTIGILTALLLYSFENEDEDDSIFKKIMNTINNQLAIRVIMYILGITLLLTVHMFMYFITVYPDSFSRTFDILFLIFHKTLLFPNQINVYILKLNLNIGHK